jgi:multisubunit Na+/H+ antiporter MnhE subunit
MGSNGGSAIFACAAAGAVVFVLWLLLAGDVSRASIGAGAIVAAAAASWMRLLDR